ncbi:uncharacterized protein LOC144655023 [Oculina patagonica]
MNSFVKILLPLSLCSIYRDSVFCKDIFISRHHGNNLPSCGKTIHTACKTIALAIAQAQWNDTIYIDGTETSRDPYLCLPMNPHTGGIYINKSLSLKRFGNAEVFLKCHSSRQIVFDGSNATETVVIELQGLTFFNSSVTARRCSLHISKCLFTHAVSFPNATAVVNFETFQGQFSLTIRESVFSNNDFPCVCVVGNSPKIEVHDTSFINNTAIWESLKLVDVAVFMVLLTSQHFEYTLSMTLINISFANNMAPFGGCLHVQAKPTNSANRQTMKGHKRNKGTIQKDVSIIPLSYSPDYVTRQSTSGRITMNIRGASFRHNVGGAITVRWQVRHVNISMVQSDFINNSSPFLGGALHVESIFAIFLQIEDCKFVENSAKKEGSAIYAAALFASKTCLIIVRNALFLRNILNNADFNEYENVGGTLTLNVPHGYLKVHLENVSFMFNKAAKGSSTFHAEGSFQELTIVNCSFVGNSQDERSLSVGNTVYIYSDKLNFTLTDTIISENEAKPRIDDYTLEGQPVHFHVEGFLLAWMNISGLHYTNNKGGGISFVLGSSKKTNSTFFLQDSCFENNELFSLGIEFESNTSLQIKRVMLTSNSFVSPAFHCLALFFLYATNGQGNQIAMQDTTFAKNLVQNTILLIGFPPDAKDPKECCRWNYKNQARFTNVTFRENQAENSTVLRISNGWNILSNCRFVDNFAVYAVSISERSTKLDLVNTSFEQTQKLAKATAAHYPHFRGFIFYASSGPINLTNTSLKVESPQDIDAYFMITGTSKAHIDNSTVIQCPVGTLKTSTNFSYLSFVSNCWLVNETHYTHSQSFIFSCKRCSPGFYSVDPFANRCLPCPFGGNCTSNIAAKPTFWGFPSLSDRGSINFQKCPTNYCCPFKNISCPYDNQHYLSIGCSGNRSGFLCGECKPGFTETLFSARCRANNVCTDNWFWPIALLYSLAFAFFLLWKNPIVRLIKRLLPRGGTTPGGHLEADSLTNDSGYVKIVFYFYQVAHLVFVSEDIEMHLADNYLLTPMLGWFDFKAVSSKDGLVCPFRGLTVPSKIFLQASQVFAVLSGVLVIFLLHGAVRKVQKISPAMPSSGQYLSATTECLLLGYSALASAALKALNCVEIQSTSRFFYDGNIQCWQWWQKLCGVFLAVFIIPFVFVLYLGSKLLNGRAITAKQFLCACIFPLPFAIFWMVTCRKAEHETEDQDDQRVGGELTPLFQPDLATRDEQSCRRDPTDDVVYGPFKKCSDDQGPGAEYWESVLIGRRLVLICLHTFIVFSFIRMVCLSVTCAAILVHHIRKKPFKAPRVNHVETASLSALLVLAVINMAQVTLSMNGELLSEQERICLTVLHVVEVIILGTVPVIFVVVIVVSVTWRLIKLCQLCLTHFYKLLVSVLISNHCTNHFHANIFKSVLAE